MASSNEMSVEEVLDYIQSLGKDLITNAIIIQGVLEEAKATNIDVNVDDLLEQFYPGGECEMQLVHMRAALLYPLSSLLNQGISMDKNAMKNRLTKMGKEQIIIKTC